MLRMDLDEARSRRTVSGSNEAGWSDMAEGNTAKHVKTVLLLPCMDTSQASS